MSKIHCPLPRYAMAATLAFVPILAAPDLADASPLDPEAHVDDAGYQSEFDKPIVPLDAALPWRGRFTAEGAFDDRFKLADAPELTASEPTAESNSTPLSESSKNADAALDARGIVKDIRPDAGKVKIEHGPIDRHGMPAMTMMFNLADPAMLEGLSQGEEIEFNVDMSASGFTITEIRRSGGSR